MLPVSPGGQRSLSVRGDSLRRLRGGGGSLGLRGMHSHMHQTLAALLLRLHPKWGYAGAEADRRGGASEWKASRRPKPKPHLGRLASAPLKLKTRAAVAAGRFQPKQKAMTQPEGAENPKSEVFSD